jgi:hypothetical protein
MGLLMDSIKQIYSAMFGADGKSSPPTTELPYDILERSLAEAPKPQDPKRTEYVPFYPRASYLAKNWKPEQFNTEYLGQLARAQALARQQNVLSPELANMFLPLALVENRHDFGVNVPLSGPGKDPYAELALKMQVTPVQSDGLYYIYADRRLPGEDENNQAMSDETARLAAMALSVKGRGLTPEQAVERWNGRGISRDAKGKVVADASNHRAKVMEMREMLKHPSNKPLREAWDRALREAEAEYRKR